MRIIRRYNELGIDIKIKDASLGQGFPVIACIATSKEKGTSLINFGAQPVLPIAIERCLTEISQGLIIFNKIDIVRSNYPQNYFNSFYYDKSRFCYKNVCDGLIPYNLNILNKELTWNYNNATWQNSDLSNRELLKRLIKLCEDNKYDIYFKDLSFLGFPCFRVYIPETINTIDDYDSSKNTLTSSYDKEYTVKVLDLLKNNLKLDEIFKTSTLLFNMDEKDHYHNPQELTFAIAVISGYKSGKYDELCEIANLIEYRNLDKRIEYRELMSQMGIILRLIKIRDFNSIGNYIDNLLDYCQRKAYGYSTLADEPPEKVGFINFEQENMHKAAMRLKKSFIEILKTRKENVIDNSYLKDYFNEIMKS